VCSPKGRHLLTVKILSQVVAKVSLQLTDDDLSLITKMQSTNIVLDAVPTSDHMATEKTEGSADQLELVGTAEEMIRDVFHDKISNFLTRNSMPLIIPFSGTSMSLIQSSSIKV
jgi:hypothetical protein